ncbi:uncharacterized protein BDR25DRAFT_357225 [Lindgomyces ingoldianus]|uniref:Uncharacterized protein n=1 Tax=Lindgomyces ingoldianus TaxID=673940 RepID=A0ACB6QQL6_9PLEO|nr:uncharacterized protein BDR25DRAFT_357225 [Lindgomyces ingoldianus]KAF2468863.1 hypothetical protein BDR25DRAFT_357225 [Lindgomyces ingoldianus]
MPWSCPSVPFSPSPDGNTTAVEKMPGTPCLILILVPLLSPNKGKSYGFVLSKSTQSNPWHVTCILPSQLSLQRPDFHNFDTAQHILCEWVTVSIFSLSRHSPSPEPDSPPSRYLITQYTLPAFPICGEHIGCRKYSTTGQQGWAADHRHYYGPCEAERAAHWDGETLRPNKDGHRCLILVRPPFDTGMVESRYQRSGIFELNPSASLLYQPQSFPELFSEFKNPIPSICTLKQDLCSFTTFNHITMRPVAQLSLVASGIGALQVTRSLASRSFSRNHTSLKGQAAAVHTPPTPPPRPVSRRGTVLPSGGEVLEILGMNQFIDCEHLMVRHFFLCPSVATCSTSGGHPANISPLTVHTHPSTLRCLDLITHATPFRILLTTSECFINTSFFPCCHPSLNKPGWTNSSSCTIRTATDLLAFQLHNSSGWTCICHMFLTSNTHNHRNITPPHRPSQDYQMPGPTYPGILSIITACFPNRIGSRAGLLRRHDYRTSVHFIFLLSICIGGWRFGIWRKTASCLSFSLDEFLGVEGGRDLSYLRDAEMHVREHEWLLSLVRYHIFAYRSRSITSTQISQAISAERALDRRSHFCATPLLSPLSIQIQIQFLVSERIWSGANCRQENCCKLQALIQLFGLAMLILFFLSLPCICIAVQVLVTARRTQRKQAASNQSNQNDGFQSAGAYMCYLPAFIRIYKPAGEGSGYYWYIVLPRLKLLMRRVIPKGWYAQPLGHVCHDMRKPSREHTDTPLLVCSNDGIISPPFHSRPFDFPIRKCRNKSPSWPYTYHRHTLSANFTRPAIQTSARLCTPNPQVPQRYINQGRDGPTLHVQLFSATGRAKFGRGTVVSLILGRGLQLQFGSGFRDNGVQVVI